MNAEGHRVEVARNPGRNTHITLTWVETQGEWNCYRQMPGVNEYARLHDLDCLEFLQVATLMQQFLDGEIAEVYLQPRPSHMHGN